MSEHSIGIYVHLPYCVQKCPYCDFNSYAVGSSLDKTVEELYVDTLVQELTYYSSQEEWAHRACASIFLGGGTPSLFRPRSIERIISSIGESFPIEASTEITLEANPGTIQEQLGEEKLRAFKAVGVTRVSMGVQSFLKDKLKFLGRIHSSEDVYGAIDNIQETGFSNFNLDLIFGVTGETLDDWEYDLHSALDFSPSHLSCYGLTIEAGTEFYRRQKSGNLLLCAEETQARFFEFTQTLCALKGYEQYEISNYARPSQYCEHNMGYWRGKDYLGLGAGAHSYLQSHPPPYGRRWSNLPGPTHYIQAVQNNGHGQHRLERLDKGMAQLEFFLLGMRLAEGVKEEDYAARFGADFNYRLIRLFEKYERYGCLIYEREQARLTSKGFRFVDEFLVEVAQSLSPEQNTEVGPTMMDVKL